MSSSLAAPAASGSPPLSDSNLENVSRSSPSGAEEKKSTTPPPAQSGPPGLGAPSTPLDVQESRSSPPALAPAPLVPLAASSALVPAATAPTGPQLLVSAPSASWEELGLQEFEPTLVGLGFAQPARMLRALKIPGGVDRVYAALEKASISLGDASEIIGMFYSEA